MPTIRDVAKRAGVAPMTVSRVLNDSGYVSEETRAKVESAISELGYVPNMLGPSLRFRQTNTLALVLTDITNPFWTTVARGVEDAAHEEGYSVILCNTDESAEKQDQYLTMLLKRRIDGILLVPTESSADAVLAIQRQGIHVVVLDREVPDVAVDVIRGDSVVVAYELARHLLELGHTRVAMLTGPKSVSTSRDRVAGYCRAMQEAGLEHNNDHIFWGRFTQGSGYEMARQALNLPSKPTALFAGNNFIAAGALQAVTEAGYRVPEDISLVSFDDIALAGNLASFLTTANQPAYDMGYQGTQLLLARLMDEGPEEVQTVLLPADVLVRLSSGPPPTAVV